MPEVGYKLAHIVPLSHRQAAEAVIDVQGVQHVQQQQQQQQQQQPQAAGVHSVQLLKQLQAAYARQQAAQQQQQAQQSQHAQTQQHILAGEALQTSHSASLLCMPPSVARLLSTALVRQAWDLGYCALPGPASAPFPLNLCWLSSFC